MLTGPIGSIVLMYAILVVMNLPAPLFGLRFEASSVGERLWFEPPGYVIPIAWFLLFALLGISHDLLSRPAALHQRWYIVGLAVLCTAYAYYTLGLARVTGISALWFGLWGNLVVIACALVVSWQAHAASPSAGWLVLPVAGRTAVRNGNRDRPVEGPGVHPVMAAAA